MAKPDARALVEVLIPLEVLLAVPRPPEVGPELWASLLAARDLGRAEIARVTALSGIQAGPYRG
jgi:hypothetical protein